MRESFESIEEHMDNAEFRHAYAASFMNSCIAAQIKTIREQRVLTQAALAELIGTKQAGISRLENVNYDAWKVGTLVKLARAFDVRLRISFEEFDSLIDEIQRFGRNTLEREAYEKTKERKARERETRTSAILLEALVPQNPQTRILPKGVRNAREISATSESLRLFAVGGADSRNESVPSESRGLSGNEMPVLEEPKLAQRA
ncbi:MAG: helix-turn-helix transcriptional regulator [Terracidiphilus sp.]|jgi:transcriptional regulator with XRE-family HTH domain